MQASTEHSGRAYLVTGAASGMGLATAKYLISQGALVAASDISKNGLADQFGDTSGNSNVIKMTLDVTQKDEVKAALAAAHREFGRLDGIANFAGTGGHRLGLDNIWETTPEEVDFILNLNVKGLYNVLHEALQPGCLSTGSGSIVHIASMFAEVGYNKGAVFSASKHAAAGMIKSAAIEAGHLGVRVNCVLP